MNRSHEINNLTKYLDNQISYERHKIKLNKIYSRPIEKKQDGTEKTHEFFLRVLNNKKFARRNNKEEELYYINLENEMHKKKLETIKNKHSNLSKENPYCMETLRKIQINVAKCRKLYQDKINKENIFFGNRILTRKSHVNTVKLEKEFNETKNMKNKQKNFALPALKKIGEKIIQNSPVRKRLIQTLREKGNKRDLESSFETRINTNHY